MFSQFPMDRGSRIVAEKLIIQRMKVVLGIDIGGTNTELGLVDKDGHILAESHTKTLINQPVENYLKELKKAMRSLLESRGDCELVGVGIGAPNGNYYKGTIDNAVNLGWGPKVPLIDLLKASFSVDTWALTNDANAAAVGEMIFGGAKGMKDFIMVTLGTGLGSGIVANGQLVLGYDSFAGELGHITAVPGGRDCGCGYKGCLETYCSATGLVRTATELLAVKRIASPLRDIPYNKLTSRDIYDAAIAGDEIATEAFNFTGEVLGRSIADMMTFSSPQAIILFGGVAKAGDLLINPLKASLKIHQRSMFSGRELEIKVSELDGAKAAILGAAATAWQLVK